MITIRRLHSALLIGLAFLACGCGEDAEVLARVARKTLDKLQATGQTAVGQFGPRLEAMRPAAREPALAERVSGRLRWDQALAGAEIQVQATEGKIELTGRVADAVQRRRAVELAETTVGVEQVIDALTVPEMQP